MNPVVFALVDAVLNDARARGWALRAWPHQRRQWSEFRSRIGWWRSTWLGGQHA